MKMLDAGGYSSALGLGIFFHAMVEEFTSGKMGAVERELEWLLKKSPDASNQISFDRELALQLYEQWRARWSQEDHPFKNDAFEWIASEKVWKFPICEGGRYLAGKSDGVLVHKAWGATFLYELKTAADRDRDSYINRLEIDSQVSNNILALKAEGIDVQGVVYDIAWKPALRRLTGRKTKPDETQEEFNARIIEAIKASPEDYFQRQIVYRRDTSLAWHLEDTKALYDAIAFAKQGNAFPRNTRNCDLYGKGSRCQFWGACIENSAEIESLYARKDRKLPELPPEIQVE